ncbi:MAG: formylglycine-generating enzyme family protein [Bryobacteraceae bacterium]
MARGFLWTLVALASAAEPGMVRIPGGEFQRGRSYEWDDYKVAYYPRANQDDRPVRAIYVDPFYLDQTEVTNKQYDQFLKSTGHRRPFHWRKGIPAEGKDAHPVVNVSWDDAAAYCAWAGKRLPTEAEWERAARGMAEKQMYPWGNRGPTIEDARYGSADTSPVCSAKPNSFGLCDMIGNVWEWTADRYGREYYAEAPARNPAGPKEGMYRVLRGGSWFDEPPLFLTTAYRSWARPGERSSTIGFRCAKSGDGRED